MPVLLDALFEDFDEEYLPAPLVASRALSFSRPFLCVLGASVANSNRPPHLAYSAGVRIVYPESTKAMEACEAIVTMSRFLRRIRLSSNGRFP